MPGALTTLLANNAMHLVPGGKRRRTKKSRRGGSTKPLYKLNDLLNHYGCAPYQGSLDACQALLRAKLDDPNTDPVEHRRITADYTRITDLADQVDRNEGGRRKKTRKAKSRGGAAARTREQVIADIEGILTRHGCGNYSPDAVETCMDTISEKLDANLENPNRNRDEWRALMNDHTTLNNLFYIELPRFGGRRRRLPKKTRRSAA